MNFINTQFIANGAITNAKAANIPANSIKGNNTGSAGPGVDLSISQVQSLLSIPTSGSALPTTSGGTGGSYASANAAFNGLSPLTTNGDILIESGGVNARLGVGATNTLLSVVGGLPSWVTKITVASPLIITQQSGFSIAYASFNNGTNTGYIGYDGTGLLNLTPGQMIIDSATGTSLNLATGSSVVLTLSAGKMNITDGTQGTSGYVWTSINTSGEGSWLAPTGFANPMTTAGDLLYENSTSAPARLAIGSTNQVLTVIGGLPSWQTPSSSGANTALSNLASTAVNANINPASTNSVNLGTAETLQFLSVNGLRFWSGFSPDAIIMGLLTGVGNGLSVTGVGLAQVGFAGYGLAVDPLYIITGSNSTASSAIATAPIEIVTGNSSGASNTGASGLISLTTGSSVGGAAGAINLLTGVGSSASGIISLITGSGTAGTFNAGGIQITTGAGFGIGGGGAIALLTGGSTSGSSGAVTITTGNLASGGTATGSISLITGNQAGSSFSSGSILLQIGTTGGAAVGKIQFQNGSQGTSGYVWTSTDTLCSGSWMAAPVSGANTSLSNLASTAVNVDLLPATNNARGLGNGSFQWNPAYILRTGTSFSPDFLWSGLLTGVISGVTGVGIAQAGLANFALAVDPLWVVTAPDATANALSTGPIQIQTGNKTAGTGNSGSILISIGTSSGGTRGSFQIQDGSQGTAGQFWKSKDTAGSGTWGYDNAGPWVTGTVYVAGNIVIDGKQEYVCITGNTAGATFAADVTSGYWRLTNTPMVGQNYVLTGNNFEDNTVGGWQICTVTLSSLIPTGAPTLGTAASITVATTATNPLSGKYSLQVSNTATNNIAAGAGIISPVYNIDVIDQAKVLADYFAYQATTGASFQNYSGTSANTWAVYIYDVTNAAWIQPAGVYNLTQNSGVGKSTSTWQVPSNMTQFRIAVLCINATTGSSPAVNTIQTTFDDFSVGPQVLVNGPAITDWGNHAWTPTGSWTTNTTYSGMWRQVGDSMELQVLVSLTGAPTGGLTINLPSGYSINTAKLAGGTGLDSSVLGTGYFVHSGTAYFGTNVEYSSASVVRVTSLLTTPSGTASPVNATTPITWASGDTLAFTFKVPITGWSSNSTMSADTDTRVAAFFVQGSSNTNIGSSPTTLTFSAAATTDTHAGWNGSTTYTIPVSGVWALTVSGVLQTPSSGGGTAGTQNWLINKNGTQVAAMSSQYGTNFAGVANFCSPVPLISYISCKAGDLITVQVSQNAGGTTGPNSSESYFSCVRLGGPAVVTATESVNASYLSTNGPTIGTSFAAFPFTTKSYDSHNAYNTSTGVYAVPVSGKYRISAVLATASIAYTTSQGVTTEVVQAGSSSVTKILSTIFGNGVANTWFVSGSATFNCLAGDTLTIEAISTVSTTANTASGYTHFEIERVGN
jgi:hypothetical protein